MNTYIKREYLNAVKTLSQEEKEHCRKDGEHIYEAFTFSHVAELFAGTDHGEKFEDCLLVLHAMEIADDFI